MGQYYIIANLDKKQYINPSKFGDGIKLLEFALDECGTLTGLATLLASGNGRGGGDLDWTGCEGDNGWIADMSTRKELRVENQFSSGEGADKKKCMTVVPRFAGKWAGDRVVVAGDYADDGLFIDEDRPLNEKEQKYVNSRYTNQKEHETTKTVNLRDWAFMHFKDISKDVINGMQFDKSLAACMKPKLKAAAERETKFKEIKK